MNRWRTIVPLLVLLGAFGSASAQGWHSIHGKGRRFVSPGQAAQEARRQNEGRVLSVDLIQDGGGRAHYRIKMLQNGKVRIVNVDASAGE
ncbi:MAG: PepSY domain-containing protein [Pseudomonadota bacterium]